MKLDTKCPSFSPSLVSGDAGSLPVRTPLSLSSKHCVLTSPSTRRKYRNEVRNFVGVSIPVIDHKKKTVIKKDIFFQLRAEINSGLSWFLLVSAVIV